MSDQRPGIVQRGLELVVRGVTRAPGFVMLVALAATIAAVLVIVFSFDIRSDIKDLLPENTPSVVETFEIADRMGSITPLTVIVESPDTELAPEMKDSELYRTCREDAIAREREKHAQIVEIFEEDRKDPPPFELDPAATEHCDNALVLFSTALVEELRALDLVGLVHFHNEKDFFEDRVLLYASKRDLEQLYTDIDEALTDARDQIGKYKACIVVEGSKAACEDEKPSLRKQRKEREESGDGAAEDDGELRDFSEEGLRARYASDFDDSEINYEGEYDMERLPDGAWVLKIDVRFRDPTTSLKANKEAQEALEEVIAEVGPERFNEDLDVVLGGGFRAQKEQYESVVRDIQVSGGTTLGGIVLLLLIFFRRGRAIALVLVPLLMSIAWTLALTFLTIGYLNLITAFIFAILLGLGIDFGIHLLARYEEARGRGRTAEDAIHVAVTEVGAANLTGALTTAATFATLIAADFRGFSQFGIVAALGVLVALLTTLTVLPAFIVLLQRWLPTPARRLVGGRVAASTEGMTRRLTTVAWILAAVVFASVGYAGSHATEIQFEDNFYRLQMRKPDWQESRDRYEVTEDRHTSPAVVLTDSLTHVHALEQIIERRKDPHAIKSLREFARLYPHFFAWFVERFGYAATWSDEHSVVPAMGLARRVLPDGFARGIPEYDHFDVEGTRALQQMNAFLEKMPSLGRALSETTEPVLAASGDYAALPHVSGMREEVPDWAHGALPSRRRSDRLTSVRDVVSIFSFMPGTLAEQRQKLDVIDRIRKRTSRRKIRMLPQDEQNEIRELRRFLVDEPVEVDDLPEWVKLRFKEGGVDPAPPREGSGVDYAFGNVVLVYQSTSSQNGIQARRFTHEMRTVRIPTPEGTYRPAMSTNAFIFADMLEQIEEDGLDVAWIALLIVLLVVLAQHRFSPLQTLVVISPLVVALGWTAGFMELFDLKLGLFNIVIIPVIIGIGIDDGIHLYHRYREEGRGGLWQSLRYTGGAIFMTSATTSVGFGGMLLSQHRGLNTMGELAVIGIGCAWLATMTVQPALILLAERFDLGSVVPDHTYDPAALISGIRDGANEGADASEEAVDESTGALDETGDAAADAATEGGGAAEEPASTSTGEPVRDEEQDADGASGDDAGDEADGDEVTS